MKFLCVACDTAMRLDRTMSPDAGSLTVIFTCPACGRETAMLTNDMETQMVRSLGVKIGGRTSPAEPMETVRGALAQQTGENPQARAEALVPGEGSKCPFTGVVAEAYAKHGAGELAWTEEARARIDRVPAFAQPFVTKGVEMHARENGYTEIDEAVVDEVKDRFGM